MIADINNTVEILRVLVKVSGHVALILLFNCNNLFSQDIQKYVPLKTVDTLEEAIISVYPGRLTPFTSPASLAVVDDNNLKYKFNSELLSVINTIPGVRMEERSPGSYRFSIRGSLLRSPFGVRNVKMYLDEYPLTDAGGNTYLNMLDFNDQSKLEVIRGPDGSIFGANTGGVVHIIPPGVNENSEPELKLSGGSYGLFSEQLSGSERFGPHLRSIQQSFQRSDGYRDNSAMRRSTIRLSDNWQYSDHGRLKLFLFAADMYYQTPGGLNKTQFEADPASSRPATMTLPGAAEQKAGVYIKSIFMGANHKYQFGKRLSHNISIFGSRVDFKNPFITNFEVRGENTYGLRTGIEWISRNNNPGFFSWNWNTGLEWQQTDAIIHNYDNNKGEKGPLQASSNILSTQHFYFTRFQSILFKNWVVEAAVSYGINKYNFKGNSSLEIDFEPQWTPRLASSLKLNRKFLLRASVSRGYSPPTTAEVRPSNNLIYTGLNPENGWNYEAGIRFKNERLKVDLSVFHFKLEQAIVRQIDISGAEYFINSGKTKQNGIELSVNYEILRQDAARKIINLISVFNSTTINDFKFVDYISAQNNYSGNDLTGVPNNVFVSGLFIEFQKRFSLSLLHNYVGKLPLNDANETYASAYNLFQIKFGKSFLLGKTAFSIDVGVDNLLNERYSLGNDINALGGRYYNAAAGRNFIISAKLKM